MCWCNTYALTICTSTVDYATKATYVNCLRSLHTELKPFFSSIYRQINGYYVPIEFLFISSLNLRIYRIHNVMHEQQKTTDAIQHAHY